MSPNAPTSGWRVTGQQETVDAGPDGRIVRGYRVQFQTGKGHQGSVFIAMERYNPNNVKAEIAAHAFQIDMVADLSG